MLLCEWSGRWEAEVVDQHVARFAKTPSIVAIAELVTIPRRDASVSRSFESQFAAALICCHSWWAFADAGHDAAVAVEWADLSTPHALVTRFRQQILRQTLHHLTTVVDCSEASSTTAWRILAVGVGWTVSDVVASDAGNGNFNCDWFIWEAGHGKLISSGLLHFDDLFDSSLESAVIRSWQSIENWIDVLLGHTLAIHVDDFARFTTADVIDTRRSCKFVVLIFF